MNTDTQFRRLFYRLAGLLTIITILLFVLAATSGPRLRQVTVDTQLSTREPNQRLIMQANQPLAKISAKQVSIEPATAFSVTNSANNVVVTFKQRLNYDTRYQVRISDVAALYGQRPHSAFEHSFKTVDPEIYYLRRAGVYDRANNAPDQLFQTTLSGKADKVLFSARRINEFAIVGNRIAVVTARPDGTNELSMVDIATGKASPVNLPGTGQIEQLQSSSDGVTYGFRFRERGQSNAVKYLNTLFIHNTEPGHLMVPVAGFGSDTLQVRDWQFAPDGTSIVARTVRQGRFLETNLLLIDTKTAQAPIALGLFNYIGSFSADGTKLSVRNQDGLAVLDIPNRKIAALPPEKVQVNNTRATPLRLQLLSNQAGDAIHAQTEEGEAGQSKRIIEYILLRRPQKGGTQTGQELQSIIYQQDTSKRILVDYQTTLNSQFVTVEEADARITHDAYPVTGRPLHTRTLIIDVRTGKTVKSVEGIAIRWR